MLDNCERTRYTAYVPTQKLNSVDGQPFVRYLLVATQTGSARWEAGESELLAMLLVHHGRPAQNPGLSNAILISDQELLRSTPPAWFHTVQYALRSFIVFSVLLLMIATPSQAQTVPLGLSGSFPQTGSEPPALPPTPTAWDISLNGTNVATSTSPAGWTTSFDYNTHLFTVSCPPTAAIGGLYKVRYLAIQKPPASATFGVVFGLNLYIGGYAMVSGETGTATIQLDYPAPIGGISVVLTSDNTALRLPSPVVVPAGSTKLDIPLTTDAVITVIDVNLTATAHMITDGDQIALFPRIDLVAAATGANKATLYWSKMIGAGGYDLYRSTISGGPYTKINAAPATTLDPGPGLIDTYMYTDTGLTTGTEYFYYVMSSNGSRSNETSAIPVLHAIPWDTGDPIQILVEASAMEAACRESDEVPPGLMVAMGPDGISYESAFNGVPATAYAMTGSLDYAQGLINDPDGNIYSYMRGLINDVSGKTSPYPHFKGYGPNGGLFRKAESIAGECGLRTILNLPTSYFMDLSYADYFDENMHKWVLNAPVQDEAWIYAGFRDGKRANRSDTGVQLTPKSKGEPSWKLNPSYNCCLGVKGVRQKTVGRLQDDHFWILPDSPILFTYKTPGYSGVKDGTSLVSYQGHLVSKRPKPGTTNTPLYIPRASFVIAAVDFSGAPFKASQYRTATGGFSIKRLNAVAQVVTHSERKKGWHSNQTYIGAGLGADIGATWGFPLNMWDDTKDGYLTLFNDGQWDDATLTWNVGSWPVGPQVTFLDDNPYFYERLITLDASK